MAAGAAAAGAGLATALIKAKSDKEERKRKARQSLGEAESARGDKISGALGSIIENLRSTLIKR